MFVAGFYLTFTSMQLSTTAFKIFKFDMSITNIPIIFYNKGCELLLYNILIYHYYYIMCNVVRLRIQNVEIKKYQKVDNR